MQKIFVLSLALASTVMLASAASANNLSLKTFERETNLPVSADTVQSTWSQLVAMGTDQFLGGTIGGFKLDESSMIAGAMTVGTSEFDNFLRTGKLNSSNPNIGNILSEAMSKGAGFNLSSFVNSFTPNGGVLGTQSTANFSNSSGATGVDGTCEPEIAQGLVDQANKHVDDIVSVASSDEFGFSSIAQTTGGMTGFAGMSCLDKLFQNAGADILFKPPSLGNLSNQLQNWSCNAAVPVAEQIAGAFGSDAFQTADYGGFTPEMTMSDAQTGNPFNNPKSNAETVYGAKFAKFDALNNNDISSRASLSKLFR